MALNPHLAAASANAACAAVTARADGGHLAVYDGAQPADGDTPPAGVLLATLALASPSFGAPVAGLATANPITSAQAVAASSATWFRVYAADGTTPVFDGSIGTAGSNVTMSTTTIVVGAWVSVTALTFAVPE